MEEGLLQFGLPSGKSTIQRGSPCFGGSSRIFKIGLYIIPASLDEVVEEGSHVQNEGVPHEVEGGVGPVEMVIIEQVLECDAVREDISERQNGVEEKELGDLDHLDDFTWGYWDGCRFIALIATNIEIWV